MSAALLLLALVPAAEKRVISHDLEVSAGFEVSVFADSTLANDIHCLTIDPKGRIIVAGRGYVRILVPGKDGKADKALEFAHPIKDGANGLFWEKGDLWCVGDGGLRRYRDVDNGGLSKPSELVFKCRTGSEHMAHAVSRGPDGWLYLLVGDQTRIEGKHATLATSPIKDPVAGCVLRLSPDLKGCEIVADGFRNAYAMDWNPDGELFTFDSDNERCVSLPWYEPTRCCHVQVGGSHGWLSPQFASTWRQPPYFLDTVAPIATLGRGSPTGIVCYRHTQFPARYRGGLFLLDWTFGVVHFVTLEKKGASYIGKPEVFARSVGDDGFAPTAAAVHPLTGDLYVSIGGRGTRGAVYRIRHTAGFTARRASEADLARLQPAPRSLDWKEGLARDLIRDATSDDLHARRRALGLLIRHREQLSEEQHGQVIRANAGQADRVLRRAVARLLAPVHVRERAETLKSLNKGHEPTTVLLAAPGWEADALVRSSTLPTSLRLDAVRLLQRQLGDIGASSDRGTVWEGYSRRRMDGEMPQTTRAILRAAFPSDNADLDRELTRTLALIEDDYPDTLKKVAATLTARSHPSDDIHSLIVLARLKAKRTASITKTIADALLRLDAKIVERKLNRDTNWPQRLGEMHAGLAARDAALNKAIVEHADFGRPDHVLWTRAAGFDKEKAAELFLARAKKDSAFAWNAGLVALVGSLPAKTALPVLRNLWGEAGLDDEILPILAKSAIEEDHARLLHGLVSPRLALVSTSLSALEKLSAKPEHRRDEGLALLRALRQLTTGKEEDALRPRLLARLTRLGSEKFTSTDTALAWYGKHFPEQAKALTSADGVDMDAWRRRLAKIDWDKADRQRGQIVYTKASCATCHSGAAALGPDLAGITGRFSRNDLFTAILQPSKDVSPRYRTTQLTTSKGKVVTGIIVYDAVDSIILQTGSVETVRLAHTQIAERRLTTTSLMPAGSLDRLSDAEIADLYAYLRSLGGK